MNDREAPLVSVVTIFRDGLPFLPEAIESVLAQTLQPIELVLVDDGSLDGSTDVARSYATRAHVRYVEHPGHANLGMSASRNLGVEVAGAPLVAFLDADDRWDADHLEHLVAVLTSRPTAGMVCAPAWDWHSWSDPRAVDARREPAFPAGTLAPVGAMLAASLRDGGVTVPTCALLVRRDVWRAVGGAESSFRGMFEDQAVLAKLHLAFASVLTDRYTAWYRQHDGSACAVAARAGEYDPDRPNRSHLRYLDWVAGYVETHQPPDPAVAADVRDALTAARRAYGNRTSFLVRTTIRRRFEPLQRRARQWTGVPGRGLRRLVPRSLRSRMRARRRASKGTPAVGEVQFGSFRRVTPISSAFGYDRGTPIDRWYIERFLAAHSLDIRGRVLEVGDDSYTRRFGGDAVTIADVLHVHEGHPEATVVADIADAPHLPDASWDCIVLTQTLHLVYDVRAAVATLHRILRPGGVVLATVPAISQQSKDEWADTWYWAMTERAAFRLFADAFGAESVTAEAHGNVLAGVAFLEGLAAQELHDEELRAHDPQYELVVTIRARKSVQHDEP